VAKINSILCGERYRKGFVIISRPLPDHNSREEFEKKSLVAVMHQTTAGNNKLLKGESL
jgi:hypothetical protein